MSADSRMGRPRSEHARTAVLNAVDDLLVEVGYGAMTMKNIAERAGVGRQTVYRWWSTKADILMEAVAEDAPHELRIEASGDLRTDLSAYLDALERFLRVSDAGTAYRALLGEAQHDPAVAALLRAHDVLGDSARSVIECAAPGMSPTAVDKAVFLLVGPVVFRALTGSDAEPLPLSAAVIDALVSFLPSV